MARQRGGITPSNVAHERGVFLCGRRGHGGPGLSEPTDASLLTAVRRGSTVPGGSRLRAARVQRTAAKNTSRCSQMVVDTRACAGARREVARVERTPACPPTAAPVAGAARTCAGPRRSTRYEGPPETRQGHGRRRPARAEPGACQQAWRQRWPWRSAAAEGRYRVNDHDKIEKQPRALPQDSRPRDACRAAP